MAGYPYNGGVYGGYSDPENNKKKTFVGPKSDSALSTMPAAIKNNPDIGPSSGAEAGGELARKMLAKTPGGYPNIGLSTLPQQTTSPLPVSRPSVASTVTPKVNPVNALARQQLAGYDGTRKNEHVPGSLDPSRPMSYVKNTDGSVSTVRSMSIGTDNGETLIPTVSPEGNILSNDQAVDRYRKTGDNFGSWKSVSDANKYASTLHENQSNLLSDPLVKRLSPGMSLSADKSTYTMGTPGQDGYGRMTVSPGTGQRSAAASQLAAGVQRPNNGYEVSGPQDAVARFNRPVSNPGNPAPDALNGGSRAAMLEQQSAQQLLASTPQVPKYMTREEGAAAGVGWKGRGQIYAQQMDAYNKATGNQNALDVEQMREGGAGARAMLAARGIDDRNAIEREGQQSTNEIARKRLTGELALNDTRIGTEQIGQQKGQMELSSLQAQNAARDEYMKNPTPENELKYRGAIGKFDKEAQFATVGRYDDQGTKVGEDLYNKQTGELRSGRTQDPAMAIIESNPSYKQAYQSADPKKQQEMIKALRERMAQGSK